MSGEYGIKYTDKKGKRHFWKKHGRVREYFTKESAKSEITYILNESKTIRKWGLKPPMFNPRAVKL